MSTAMVNVRVDTIDDPNVKDKQWSEFWTANLSIDLLPQFFERVTESQKFFSETKGEHDLRITIGQANRDHPSYTTAQELKDDFDANW